MPRKSATDGFQPLAVVKDEPLLQSNSVLASEIRKIAEGVTSLQRAGLTDDAIELLVWGAIPKSYGISPKTVGLVLGGLYGLEKKYLKRST
jgi:hypothetical protein